MKISEFLPQPDLLQQVEGVETRLRRGERISVVGWIVVVLSIAQLVPAVAIDALSGLGWPVWIALALLVVGLVLINWTTVWVRQSKTAFRYTYSVAPFEPVGGTQAPDEALAWLREDLSEKLSDRIRRLSRLNEDRGAEAEGTNRGGQQSQRPSDRSHIEIGGTYGFRRRPAGAGDAFWNVEVTPWIRIGSTTAGYSLAHPVKFELPEPVDRGKHKRGVRERVAAPPEPDLDDYETLVERVYFSVATEIYKQIKQDVERKIELLPRRAYRATAYFHEAQDYVGSNTLDAYDEARELYEAVIRIRDPDWTPQPRSRRRRTLRRWARWRARSGTRFRDWTAKLFPRVARGELMFARALTGYAKTLAYRRSLAALSGQRLNPVFEARQVAARALERLTNLPDDVPGKREAVLEAQLTLALAWSTLGSEGEAEGCLNEARRREPTRVEQDALYLYVSGLVEPRLVPKIQLLRRAVEIDPSFEAAQFELAIAGEMLWRTRPDLEPTVARMVFEEYGRVLTLNPGNIAAWANLGYMRWLLGQLDRAKRTYERGREYKEIKRETFVAELDYGLARIAAETHDVGRAYKHYIAAVTATTAQGIRHGGLGYTDYQFDLISEKMVARFRKYRDEARTVHERVAEDVSDPPVSDRIRDSVYAFVLNDYGQACHNAYLRTGDDTHLSRARKAFDWAETGLKSRYVLLDLNLHRLHVRELEADTYDGAYIDRIDREDPNWVDGNLDLLLFSADRIPALETQIAKAREDAKHSREDAETKRERAAAIREKAWAALADVATTASAEGELQGVRLPPTRGQTDPYGLPIPSVETAQAATTARPTGMEPSEPGPQAVSERAKAEFERLERDAKTREHEATTLEDEARKANEAAAENEDKVAELEEELARRKERWDALLEALLPHEWLWKRDADGDSQLDPLGALARDEEYRRELRWERELDEVHVRALFAWCQLFPERDAVERVLGHIRDRFWPDNWDVLNHARVEYADTRAAARMRAILDRALRGEPEWWRLTWVDPELFPEKRKRLSILSMVCERKRVPPSLFVWVGDQLAELGAAAADVTDAYRRARGSSSPGALRSVAARLEVRGELRDSIDVYRQALTARDEADRAHEVECRLGIARALWGLGRGNDALQELDAFPDVGDDHTDWRTHFVHSLVTAGAAGRADAFRLLRHWLHSQRAEQHAAGDVANERDSETAALELVRTLYDDAVRGDSGWRTHGRDAVPPTAIAVEAHPDFFPRLAETPDVQRMIVYEIPEMRDRIREAYGLTVPAVRIRPNPNLGEHTCRVLFHEATAVLATVPEARDPYTYMIEIAEEAIRGHLAVFFGRDDAKRLLDEWEGDDEDRCQLRQRVLGLEAATARFFELLRALLRERVSIVPLTPIVQAFADADGRNVDELVEQTRTVLPLDALGVTDRTRFLSMPRGFEEELRRWVHEGDGERFLALPAETLARLGAELQRPLGDATGDVALVVRDPLLRPYVRRVVEVGLPSARRGRQPLRPQVISRAEIRRGTDVEPIENLAASGR